MIVINFKNYVSGEKAEKLAFEIKKYLSKVILCIDSADLSRIKGSWAQHVDYIKTEKSTGMVSAEDVKNASAVGTLLNHSEHRIPFDLLKKTTEQCKKEGLKIIVCVLSLREAKRAVGLKPWGIAFEDEKLIGSGKSITEYNSEDVKSFAKLLKRTKIKTLCGAGISNVEDVKKAYELGCKGVLISSAIANVKNPESFLVELEKLEV
ncbi:MAG: triose-phosphate isomerase [Nanoarchaeota archaeon]